MSAETPEPGPRAKVKTDGGERTVVYPGDMWASEDPSEILQNVEPWEEEPVDGELEIKGLPEQLEVPPVGGEDEEE